jgi:hypothetical protein
MRYTFGYSLKETTVAVFLSCTIASFVCAVTAPTAAVSDTGITVNRASKGDRLRSNPTVRANPGSAISTHRWSPPVQGLPGCEPTFSPVTDPALADAVGRCLT